MCNSDWDSNPCAGSWTHVPGLRASQVARVVKKPSDNTGDGRDVGSIPGSGRSPGGENGKLLQYSCLGMDRGAWQTTVHGVTKSFNRWTAKKFPI